MFRWSDRQLAQRAFVDYARDLARVRFAPALWRRLSDEDRGQLRRLAAAGITAYFLRGVETLPQASGS